MHGSFNLKCITELKGHEDRAWDVAWNPKKTLLATCSADKTVRIYAYFQPSQPEEPLKFTHVHTLPTGHAKTVRTLAWNPSGTSLACGSFDSTVSIWEQEGGDEWECVATLEGPESEIKGLAYSAGGTLLATCSRDKSVWVWEVLPDNEHETVSVLMGQHAHDIKCVCWNPIEEILASGSYDDSIKLYMDDPSDDWYDYATLKGHESTVWSLAFSPCGRYLSSASDDKTVKVWAPSSNLGLQGPWQCALTLKGHRRSIYSVSWGRGHDESAGNLGWLGSTGSDGTINIWSISANPETDSSPKSSLIASQTQSHGFYDTNAISFSPRKGFENYLATVGDDGLAKIWRLDRESEQ